MKENQSLLQALLLSPCHRSFPPFTSEHMSDVRALLKAKREQRVQHQYASYNGTQLRCSACGLPVKNSSAWEGHLGTKAHRTNVARLKAEEEKAKVAKRKGDDEGERISDVKKRRMDVAEGEDEDEEQPIASASTGFPADFFSDPSQAPVAVSGDPNGEEEESTTTTAPTKPIFNTAIDAEWEEFERAVLNPPAPRSSHTEAYSRATIMAEPELIDELPAGFPSSVLDGRREELESAANAAAEEVIGVAPPEESEGDARKRKEREEKELIMVCQVSLSMAPLLFY
jgi:zinc finger protein 830